MDFRLHHYGFGGREGSGVTESETEGFVVSSVAALQEKQDALADAYGIGRYTRFWFDQPSGTLEFRDEREEPSLSAEVIPIGSFSPRSKTWMWAWANNSILPALRERANRFRGLAEVTGMPLLAQEVLNVTEEMPWEITAMAVRHIDAIGAYRAPGRASDLYLAIIRVFPVRPA